MKECLRCKKIKDDFEFHKNKNKKDGFNECCKACRKEIYTSSGGRELNRNRYKKYYLSKKGHDSTLRRVSNYRDKNNEKVVAHNKLNHSINNGHLSRSKECSKCGKKCKPDGHHEDYSKPLEVVWLCRECHRSI